MFEFADACKLRGMAAYCQLQDKEFSSKRKYGYDSVRHQQFTGAAYFDTLQQEITSGTASSGALEGSTEVMRFHTRGKLALTDGFAAIPLEPQQIDA